MSAGGRSSGPESRSAAGDFAGVLHEPDELLRVEIIRAHQRERPLELHSLSFPERTLGRAAQQPAGFAVDPDASALEAAGRRARLGHGGKEARDRRGAEQRLLRRHRLAAAVGIQDSILGQQLLQGLQVSLLGGREEPFEQRVTGRLVGRIVFLLALSAGWPLPLVNVIPGVLVVLIAIAYLQEDGLLLTVAMAAALLSLLGLGWTLWKAALPLK